MFIYGRLINAKKKKKEQKQDKSVQVMLMHRASDPKRSGYQYVIYTQHHRTNSGEKNALTPVNEPPNTAVFSLKENSVILFVTNSPPIAPREYG